MFTGIVQTTQRIKKIEEKTGLRTFWFSFSDKLVDGLQIGASISLSGACMTVTSIDASVVGFDAMQETLDKTILGLLQEGDEINVERSFRIGDEVGGHILSGHVTGRGEIVDIEESDNNKKMFFRVPAEWMKYILPKGFIAVDGCSLTIVDVTLDTFSVSFIPETLKKTTFGTKGVGDFVNIEIDSQTQAIVDTVERVMAERD